MLPAPMRRFLPILAVLLVLLGVFALPAAVGAAKRPPAKGLILSPRPGATYPSRPLAVRIRTPRDARVVVHLNGAVTRWGFARRRRGRLRVLEASPSHGLRYGKNVLRVRVKAPGAHRGRAQRLVFHIAGLGPMAAAGRDRRITTGARIELDGTRSRLHPSRGDARLDHEWRLLRAPRGSGLAARVSGRARASGRRSARVVHRGPRALFGAVQTATPAFRPDAPGVYKLDLEATGPRGASSHDEVVLRVEPEPLVPIDTIALGPDGKTYGIRVGRQFYPDPGESKKWLQVLVLRKDNLEFVSNQAYDCPRATTSDPTDTLRTKSCIEALRDDLTQLAKGPPVLVFAVSQRLPGKIGNGAAWYMQPPVGAWNALWQITGVPPHGYGGGATRGITRGRLSVIGSFEGHRLIAAHDNLDLDDLRDDGEIVGALVRDNKGMYSTYRSAEQVPYETNAAGSDGQHDVIAIGDDKYTADLSHSAGGFHVVVLEPMGLAGDNYWFETGGAKTNQERLQVVEEMRKTLAGYMAPGRAPSLVFISSRGDARLKVPDHGSNHDLNSAVEGLVDLLTERFGATRGRAYRAFDPYLGEASQRWPGGNRSYTLVAKLGTRRGDGLEAEAAAPVGAAGNLSPNTAPMAGSLTRLGADYGFGLETSAEGEEGELDGPGIRLRDVAFGPVGNWPEQGNPGRTAAIKWAVLQVGLDTRRGYLWTQPPSFNWSGITAEIKDLRYPKEGVDFSPADLSWAQGELRDEIGWLEEVRAYVAELSEPLSETQQTEWASFARVAAEVGSAIQVPKDDKVLAKMELVFDAVRDVSAEMLPENPGKIIGTMNGIYDAVAEWSKLDGEGTEAGDEFNVVAAEFGEELASRLAVAQRTLKRQLVQVIASDYGKLRTVGLCAAASKQCPDGPPAEWQVTAGDQEAIRTATERGLRAAAYAALVPAKYTAWEPAPSPWRSVNWEGHQPAGELGFVVWNCPFNASPQSAQFSYPVRRDIGSHGGGNDTWQVVAYGERTGEGVASNLYKMVLPQASVTDPMFRSASLSGGLGMSAEKFFADGYLGGGGRIAAFDWPGGLTDRLQGSGFPLQASQVRWISKDDPAGPKTESCHYG